MSRRHRRILIWSAAVVAATVIAGGLTAMARKDSSRTPLPGDEVTGLTDSLARKIPADHPKVSFQDVTDSSGIRFRHFHGQRSSLLVEDMGSGAGWADFDNDGDLDLFVANIAGPFTLKGDEVAQSPAGCALYRNKGDGTFEDVSAQFGLDVRLIGMGVSWGDYDDDGDLDLYLTANGPNHLFRNDGDHFTDVSRAAGVDDGRFGAGAAWADYDRDGDLDLYLANYVQFTYTKANRDRLPEQLKGELPYTLNPSSYPPEKNLLYRNNGDGTFTDAAGAAGCADSDGRGMAVSWLDFNGDGWLDLYVANDVSKNGVYLNGGDGTFKDIGASSLAADYRGAMGLAVGDPDNDGDLDMFVTHWIAQENGLLDNQRFSFGKERSDGRILFMDFADARGLGQISLDTIGWGTAFLDYDNDNRLDLFVVNGSTFEMTEDTRQLVPMRQFMFWNRGRVGFFEVGPVSGEFFSQMYVGRGAAFGDYDNDGDVDVFVVVHGGAGILLSNDGGNRNHWLKLRLRQPKTNRFAVGALVRVLTGKVWQTRLVGAGTSYLSHNSLELEYGLGSYEVAERIEITWPDGQKQTLKDVSADQILEIRKP